MMAYELASNEQHQLAYLRPMASRTLHTTAYLGPLIQFLLDDGLANLGPARVSPMHPVRVCTLSIHHVCVRSTHARTRTSAGRYPRGSRTRRTCTQAGSRARRRSSRSTCNYECVD